MPVHTELYAARNSTIDSIADDSFAINFRLYSANSALHRVVFSLQVPHVIRNQTRHVYTGEELQLSDYESR